MYTHREIEDMFCLAFPDDVFEDVKVLFNNSVTYEFLARSEKRSSNGAVIQYQLHYKPNTRRLVCNYVYDGIYGYFGDTVKQVKYEVSYDITYTNNSINLVNASDFNKVEFERMW